MHATQNPEWFVTYLEGFLMNIGNETPIVVDEEPSVTQN